ncbi:hypothetical protein ACH5RR_007544 [Cinchona calisaya]|uniref:Uncharacterized protein n=1 Tax=Cinchona calisaya TaxID=153742 RepID=A0ABD3AS46_9GENT
MEKKKKQNQPEPLVGICEKLRLTGQNSDCPSSRIYIYRAHQRPILVNKTQYYFLNPNFILNFQNQERMEAMKMKVVVVAVMMMMAMAFSAVQNVAAVEAPAPAPASDASLFVPTVFASVAALAMGLLF